MLLVAKPSAAAKTRSMMWLQIEAMWAMPILLWLRLVAQTLHQQIQKVILLFHFFLLPISLLLKLHLGRLGSQQALFQRMQQLFMTWRRSLGEAAA